jgi:ribosomal protein S18 acetylase RimI-like enzyme
MNLFSVRDYRSGDFAEIADLWALTGVGGTHRGDNAEVIENTLRHGAKLWILIENSNQSMIGTSWLTHDHRRIYLHHFCIHPDYQGRKLAWNLLEPSLLYAKEKGMQIKLEVHRDNLSAVQLYLKAGFKYLGDYDVYIIRDI